MPELSPRRRLLVLAICCSSLFIVGLDVTIVNIALPSIKTDLHASVSGLQWTLDAYTVVLASLLMLAGSTADRLGRRRVFQTGLLLFTLASVLCSVAPSLGWLIAFRMLQAVGGSMLNPVAMSIITNTFTDPRERARAIGVWGGVVGISLALGPVIGGGLVESVGWRSIFWINIPVGLAAVVLASRFVPESRAPHPRRLDPVGQVLVIAVLASVTYAIIEGPSAGFRSARTLGMFAFAAVSLVGLIAYERRRPQPLVEVRLFRSAPFSGATAIAVFAFASLGGFLFLNTLYLQDVRGLSAFHAGLYTLPMAGMTLIFAPISGRLVGSHGPRPSLVAAGVAMTVATPDADPAADPHLARLAVHRVRDLRFRLRGGERADHQYGRLGLAARAGRRGGGVRVDQPADRRLARRGRHRIGSYRPGGRELSQRLRRGEPRRLVDPHRLRRRGPGPGCSDDGPMGSYHCRGGGRAAARAGARGPARRGRLTVSRRAGARSAAPIRAGGFRATARTG